MKSDVVGARGGKEEGMKLDEFYTVPCPVEGCGGKVTVRSMPHGYTGLCPCQAVWLRLGWATTVNYNRIPYLVVVPEEPTQRRRRRG